jgi:NADH-quinone oxidoreductase subunit N
MLPDIDRMGPELVLMVTGGLIILADLVLRESMSASRRGMLLAGGGMAGIVGAIVWAVTLILRDRQGTAFNGSLVVDNFSFFFTFLFLGIAILVILASIDYAQRFGPFQGEYYALILLATGGMILLAGGRDLIAIFVALELTAISQYVLAALLKDTRSTEAGLKYLLLGAVSTAVLLYGMAFLFGLSGTTKLIAPAGEPSIAATVAGAEAGMRGALVLAIVFLAAGLAFKTAVVPFQMWAPDVYEGSPTPVAAYLSVASKAAGFAVVLRIFYDGLSDTFISSDWSNLFAAVAAISMTTGNVMALVQTNIKRLLGYSSIAQAGNIMVGVAAISAANGNFGLGAGGVVFFLATYAFTNLGAFIAVIAISGRLGSDAITDYAGMSRRSPLLAAALALCLVSLTGLPLTAGFVAKLYIFNAAVQSDLVWLVIVAVLNAVLAAYYYLRIVGQMYLSPPPKEEGVPVSWSLAASLGVAALGVLVIGIVPTPLISAAERAVNVFA